MTTGSLSRDAGGLFESVRSLGKALAVSNVEVGVCGLLDKNWEKDKAAWEALPVKACAYLGPRAVAWSPEMDAELENFRPDLVHLNGLWQYASIATRRLWRKHGTSYVVSPRGMLDFWALANARWKKKLAGWFFENAVLRDAGCLHSLCAAEADAIRAYGLRQRIEVVPNGVDLPEMENGKWEMENAQKRKRLLFLGRIHPKKGLVGALRAWAQIRHSPSAIRNSADWQFVIAGWDQGGHEGELRALCAELGLKVFSFQGAVFGGRDSEDLKLNSYKLKTLPPEAVAADVVFWGPAFGEEKNALLRSAEAFILPSLSEGLPMSVLEAWAYGLPVVVTPECNLPEGFASQAALEIRNAGMGNSKWEGLRALLDMSDSDRIEMGKKGRRLVEEKFTWPKVAAQMKALYEEILGGG